MKNLNKEKELLFNHWIKERENIIGIKPTSRHLKIKYLKIITDEAIKDLMLTTPRSYDIVDYYDLITSWLTRLKKQKNLGQLNHNEVVRFSKLETIFRPSLLDKKMTAMFDGDDEDHDDQNYSMEEPDI